MVLCLFTDNDGDQECYLQMGKTATQNISLFDSSLKYVVFVHFTSFWVLLKFMQPEIESYIVEPRTSLFQRVVVHCV